MQWTKNTLAALISAALLSGCFSDDEKAAAHAGDNLAVKERRSVQVTNATANGEGNVRIAWTQVSGPQLIISGANTLTPTFIAQSVDADAEAVMRMIVTDAKGQVAEDEMSITISNNTLPQLNSQPEPVAEKAEVSVTADVIDDGEIRQVLWQQTGGPDVELSGEDSLTVSFTSPVVTELTTLMFEVQVLDDDGEIAKLAVNIDVQPTLVDVVLQGQVTGADFSNGTASLKGAAQEQTINVDENGQFVFSLQLDDDALMSALLAVEITQQASGPIKYAAAYSGFSAPVQQASGNVNTVFSQPLTSKPLTSEPEASVGMVTVTAVSTALYSLLVAANNGELPANIDELKIVEKSLDADELTEAAAVVKILSETPDLVLPEGITDLVSLLMDVAAYNAVAEQIETEQPGLIAETVQAIIADPELTPPLSAETVAPVYFQTFAAATGFLSRGGERWQFNADGSGALAKSRGLAQFNWQLQAGAIAVTFNNAANVTTSFNTVNVGVAGLTQQQVDWLTAEGISQVNVTSEVTASTLSRVTTGQAIDTFRHTGVRTLRVGPITTAQGVVQATSTESFSNNILMRKQISTAAEFDPEQMTGTWALNTYYPLALPQQGGEITSFYLDPLSFSASGSGTGTTTGRTFTWQVIDGQLMLVLSDGSHVKYEIMDQTGNDYQVFTTVYDAADNLVAAQADYGFKANLNGQAIPANLGSVYWQTMINSWDKHSWDNGRLLFCQGDANCETPAQSYTPAFGWQFVTGGTGTQYFTSSPVAALPPLFEYATNPLSWVKTNPVSMNFTYANSKRFWILLKEEQGLLGRRLYVREESYNTTSGARTIGGRINMYEEIPLSYWNDTAPQPASAAAASASVLSLASKPRSTGALTRKVFNPSPKLAEIN